MKWYHINNHSDISDRHMGRYIKVLYENNLTRYVYAGKLDHCYICKWDGFNHRFDILKNTRSNEFKQTIELKDVRSFSEPVDKSEYTPEWYDNIYSALDSLDSVSECDYMWYLYNITSFDHTSYCIDIGFELGICSINGEIPIERDINYFDRAWNVSRYGKFFTPVRRCENYEFKIYEGDDLPSGYYWVIGHDESNPVVARLFNNTFYTSINSQIECNPYKYTQIETPAIPRIRNND